MINRFLRLFSRPQPQVTQGKIPEFFDVPCLQPGDEPVRTFLSAQTLSRIISIRITKSWSGNTYSVIFDALGDSKGGTYPVICLRNRTLEDANKDADRILAAMKEWCEGKNLTIIIDPKRFNKVA